MFRGVFLFYFLVPVLTFGEGFSYEWKIPMHASKRLAEIIFELHQLDSDPIDCSLNANLSAPLEKVNAAERVAIQCQSPQETKVLEIRDYEMSLFGGPHSKWLGFEGEQANTIFERLRVKAWSSKATIFDNFEVAPIVSCSVPDEAPYEVFGCHESYFLSGTLKEIPKAVLFCSRTTEPKDETNVTRLLSQPGLDASMDMRRNLASLIENEISFGIRVVSESQKIRCVFLEP